MIRILRIAATLRHCIADTLMKAYDRYVMPLVGLFEGHTRHYDTRFSLILLITRYYGLRRHEDITPYFHTTSLPHH